MMEALAAAGRLLQSSRPNHVAVTVRPSEEPHLTVTEGGKYAAAQYDGIIESASYK